MLAGARLAALESEGYSIKIGGPSVGNTGLFSGVPSGTGKGNSLKRVGDY